MERSTLTLHPGLLQTPAWKDANLWRVWCWCLLSAARKARTISFEGMRMRLAPGEAAAPLAMLARSTGLSPHEVRTSLQMGKTLGLLEVRATPWALRIVVVNWQ